MDAYTQTVLTLTGLIVLSGVAVTAWCIATDDRYMEGYRESESLGSVLDQLQSEKKTGVKR